MKKPLKHLLAAGLYGLAGLAALASASTALAQNALNCAWPLTVSPSGSGNYLAPDDQARYWMMPMPAGIRTLTLRGAYPNARYFSFVAYDGDASGRPVGAAGDLYDSTIVPDGTGAGATYTVRISRDPAVSGMRNGIAVGANDAWVALRMYVPRADTALSGNSLTGGVPLPTVAIDDGMPLQTCPPAPPMDGSTHYPVRSVNKLEDLRAFLQLMFPPGFDLRQPADFDQPASGRLWFSPPRLSPPLLFPNPHNKYILMTPGPYQAGRVIVLRARAPDTTERLRRSPQARTRAAGAPEMRYWSVCNNDFALPIGVVRCMADTNAAVEGGYYTVVISDDLTRPRWLRPGVNWLPWGDPQYPKLVFFRHMLPADDFPYAVQRVVEGCPDSCVNNDAVFDFTLPDLPSRPAISAAGPAVQRIMGEYYPVAAWCDRATVERGGWQACLGRP